MSTVTESTTTARPLRADAQRNRARLLEVAHEHFRRLGADASLDDIARAAGVGSGTLYRHFPTRTSLIVAVSAETHHGLLEQARTLHDASDPGAALVTWLEAVVTMATEFDGLADEMRRGMDDSASELHGICLAMSEAFDALILRAQAVGAIRPEVEPGDVRRLVHGIAHATQCLPDRPAEARRLLGVVLAGLQA